MLKPPEPMLAQDLPDKDLETFLKDPKYGMERKRDGKRMRVRLSSDLKPSKALSRTGKGMDIPQAVREALAAPKWLSEVSKKDFFTDGELIWVDKKGKDHRTEAQAGKGSKPIYAVWDIILPKMPYIQRKTLLMELCKLNNWYNGDSPVEYQSLYVNEKSKRKILKLGKKQGWEGYVFKELAGLYRPGCKDIYRWKYTVTDDYIVIGYTESDKAKNPFRALVLAQYDKNGNLVRKGQCGGGFPDKKDKTNKMTRTEIHEKYLRQRCGWFTMSKDEVEFLFVPKNKQIRAHKFTDKDYGKSYGTIHWLFPSDYFVIEVKSQGLTEYGVPFMGQMQDIRDPDDKESKDCIAV